MSAEKSKVRRSGKLALRVCEEAYPYRCCVICGLTQDALDVAHLDQDPSNDDPDNLAFLCKTHHWMYDCGLYPVEAVKLLRAHWQQTEGKVSHAARMKDAGALAARTRKRRAAGRKAALTNAARKAGGKPTS